MNMGEGGDVHHTTQEARLFVCPFPPIQWQMKFLNAALTLLIIVYSFGLASEPSKAMPGQTPTSGHQTPTAKTRSRAVAFTLIDRKEGLFQIKNITRKEIKLPAAIAVANPEEEFSPASLSFEFMKQGKWKELQWGFGTLIYPYPLASGRSVVFRVDLHNFDRVREGTWVRIRVEDYFSELFKR